MSSFPGSHADHGFAWVLRELRCPKIAEDRRGRNLPVRAGQDRCIPDLSVPYSAYQHGPHPLVGGVAPLEASVRLGIASPKTKIAVLQAVNPRTVTYFARYFRLDTQVEKEG